jgi:hypothetical protein
VLEYADDMAIVDGSAEEATARLGRFADGAWADASMVVSVEKTQAMFVRPRASLAAPGEEDYEAAGFKVACEHCGRGFPGRESLRSHLDLGWCGFQRRLGTLFEEEFEAEEVVDARGDPAHRWFLVRWRGAWEEGQETWQHSSDLGGCRDLVQLFWERSGLDKDSRIEVAGEHRCGYCNRFFKRAQDVKAHHTRRKGGCELKPGSRKGSLAEKAVERQLQEAVQQEAGEVMLAGKELKNVFCFKYLGHLFYADGDHTQPVKVRAALAKAEFSKLGGLWRDAQVGRGLKLRLFKAGIVSILAYGVEAWVLDQPTRKLLRGWCSRCLQVITGRTHREECVEPTFDLVKHVLATRQRWLGHMLRSDEGLLARQVLLAEVKWHKEAGLGYKEGSLLSECPDHESAEHLVGLAEQKGVWRLWSKKIELGEVLA